MAVNTAISNDPYNRFRDKDDVCSNNHRQNRESVAAWNQVLEHLNEMQEEVLLVIQTVFPNSITNKEIGYELNWPLHRVTPRTCELKIAGLIEPTEETRNGSRCLRLASGLPRLSRSAVKIEASRRNGKKGGRPPKEKSEIKTRQPV